MNQFQKFARPHHSGVCAKAARLHPSSLGRAVAIIHNQERQRSSGTALGLRWGMYRTTCAVGTTGRRFAGLGCHRRGFELSAPRGYDLLTGRGLVGSGLFSSALSHFDGIGRRANVPFAHLIQNGRQRAFQCLAKCPHSHSNSSVVSDPKTIRGGHDEIHELHASGEAHDC